MSLLSALGLGNIPVVNRPSAAASPSASPSAAAAKVKAQLETQLAEWRKSYQKVAPAQAWLETRIAATHGDEQAEWKDKKAEVDKKAKEAERRIRQAQADVEALSDPRSDAATFNAILARQKSAATVDVASELDRHDGSLEKKRTENKTTLTTTGYADGKATRRTDETTTTVGAGSVTKTNRSEKETVTANGSSRTSDERTSKLSTSGVEYDRKTHGEHEQDGETRSVDKTTSARLGADGASRTDTRKTTAADGSAVADSRTSSIERGDGRLGRKEQQSHTTTDTEGNETTHATTTKGGVIAGKDGMGAYAGREKEFERKGKNGLTTGAVAGLDAKVVCNVKAIDGTPPTYDLSISINLGVSASLSTRKEQGEGGAGSMKEKGSGSVGASVGGSVAVFMNRHYVLGETEAQAYVAALQAASKGGGGGSQQEFAIVRTGVSKSWDAAREMYLAASGKALAPAELARLKAGESVETGSKTKGGGSVNVDAKSFGVNAGYELGHDASTKVTKEKDGKLTYETSQGDSEKLSGGAKASVGVVEGGASFSHTNTTSTGYKISIDPAGSNAAAMQKALAGCKNQKDLDAFAAKYPDTVQEKTTGKGTADTQTASVGIGGVKAELGYGNSLDAQETRDKSGKLVHKTVTGASHGGLDISIGKLKIGASGDEKAVADIDADGNATVDVGKTDTSTDAVKFLQAHVPGMADKDDKKKKGALTAAAGGAEPEDTDTKDVKGIKLKGADLKYLGALACNDFNKWKRACPSPSMLDDWTKAGNAVRRAGGSQAAVAQALATFVGADSGGRSDVVNALVRPAGDVSSGSRYEFPDKIARCKADYEALVVESCEATLDTLAKGDDGAKKAADAGAELLDRLERLYRQVGDAQGFTQPAVQGEMLGAINARKEKVNAKLRVLGGGKADELSKKEVMEKYNALLRTCTKYKNIETGCFDAIAAYFKDHSQPNLGETIEISKLVKQLRDLHATWAPSYDEMAGLAQENGFGKGIYWKYKPDDARFALAVKGNPGGASPAQEETADKRKKPPPPPPAPADPVGDSDRGLKVVSAKLAQGTESKLPAAKNRAYGAGNNLARKIAEERKNGAVGKHNDGMAKLKSADGYAKRVKPGNVDDLNAYGAIAIEDYDAATKLFREGLAMYPAKAKA